MVETETCGICLDDMINEDEMSSLKCHAAHKFHTSCITDWICVNPKCPMCQTPIASGDVDMIQLDFFERLAAYSFAIIEILLRAFNLFLFFRGTISTFWMMGVIAFDQLPSKNSYYILSWLPVMVIRIVSPRANVSLPKVLSKRQYLFQKQSRFISTFGDLSFIILLLFYPIHEYYLTFHWFNAN